MESRVRIQNASLVFLGDFTKRPAGEESHQRRHRERETERGRVGQAGVCPAKE